MPADDAIEGDPNVTTRVALVDTTARTLQTLDLGTSYSFRALG